ncbi:hypothetical protein AURDEDRAFT_64619, partial [Auricularia subglabra TFB-10046 SS5]
GSSAASSRPAFSVPASTKGAPTRANTYGQGSSRVFTIPAGQPFAGRQQGGGTRGNVYGNNVYGSGYPGTVNQRGVGGLGFPFYFWPLAWGGGLGYGAGYLHSHEYGNPDNKTRPGGPMMQMAIRSPAPVATYHIVADNATVVALRDTLTANCSSISNKPLQLSAFSGGKNDPQPETTVQYYRASSVALTLEGYNNTAALFDDDKLPATPLPSGIDRNFLNCLNTTIGASVPLIGAAYAPGTSPWLVLISVAVIARNLLL